MNVTKVISFDLRVALAVPFSSDHEGCKSSRLDSYNKLGAVVVWCQPTPLEAFVVARNDTVRVRWLPLAFPSAQWPPRRYGAVYRTAQAYLGTATLGLLRRPSCVESN